MKNKLLKYSIIAASISTLIASQAAVSKDNESKFFGDFRLRYEGVSQDNALKDADALTLRSRVGFKTASVGGFSALIEVENNLELISDFSVPPTGDRVGEFSVVADPETTEIDQAFFELLKRHCNGQIGSTSNHDGWTSFRRARRLATRSPNI